MSDIKIQHSQSINYAGELVPLGSQISGQPDGGNQDQGKAGMWVAGVALVAAGASFSSPAQASIGGILDSLVNKAQEMLKPLLESTFGAFGSLINSGMQDSSSAIVQANATGADSLVQAMKAIADNEVALESLPPPSYCESDEIGAASNKIGTSSQMTLDSLVRQSALTHSSSDNQIYSTKINGIAERYGPNSEAPNRHIELASILSSNKVESQTDVKAYVDGVDAMSSSAMKKIQLDPTLASSTSGLDRARYVEQSGKAAKLELAKGVMYESLSERMVSESGESKLSLMDKEVDRTYGGEGPWRNELLDYAAPTPLLVELNKQQAFTNYLLLEQLKKVSKQNLIIAAKAIGES